MKGLVSAALEKCSCKSFYVCCSNSKSNTNVKYWLFSGSVVLIFFFFSTIQAETVQKKKTPEHNKQKFNKAKNK